MREERETVIEPTRLPDGSWLLADVQQAERYFKEHGYMLYVEPVPSPDGGPPIGYEIIRRNSGNTKLHGGEKLYCLLYVTPSSKSRIRHRPKEDKKRGIGPAQTDAWVSRSVLEEINTALKDEASTIRRLSSWPVRRSFVYIDVSDFSTYRQGRQALIVNTLTAFGSNAFYWPEPLEAEAFKNIEARLSIGDGYIFCFKQELMAVYFAARLASRIDLHLAHDQLPVSFHFRMGVHVGPVYHFWDKSREAWNYVGSGITGGKRVLDAIGTKADDLIFISHQVRKALRGPVEKPSTLYRAVLTALDNRGRHVDKHGKRWRVYVLNHSRLESLEDMQSRLP